MTTIRIEGADELIKRIDSLAGMQRVKDAIRAAGEHLEGKIKDYPTPSHRPNPMLRGNTAKAQRMRAGFFWHMNNDPDFHVPYRRTKRLEKDWSTRTENSGFRAIVGNGMSYARLVQDSAKQASYHRQTGWLTTRQAEMLYGKQAINIVEQAIQREVNNG